MGYACPVCAAPQADGEHLANHLAFTALLHGEDHEAWLDERVSNWEDRQPADLASVVTEYATAEEFPQVFEDTTVANDHSRRDSDVPDPAPDVQAAADEVVNEILEEARDLTHEAAERRDAENDGTDAADEDSEDA